MRDVGLFAQAGPLFALSTRATCVPTRVPFVPWTALKQYRSLVERDPIREIYYCPASERDNGLTQSAAVINRNNPAVSQSPELSETTANLSGQLLNSSEVFDLNSSTSNKDMTVDSI